MSAIFKREMRSYFHSPLGYVFLTLIYLFSGYFFCYVLANSSSYIQYVFGSLFTIVMILIPFLTMRLLSEDKKLKTDQLLLTSPINIGGIVWGKYFAAFVMYFIGIASTLIFGLVMSAFTKLNWNILLGNFLGLALFGAALIAIGLFVSSLTESQMIAAIVTYAITMFIFFFDMIAQTLPSSFAWLATFISKLSFNSRYNDLISGVLNISHIIFFVSIVVIFNFITVRVIERKRWS